MTPEIFNKLRQKLASWNLKYTYIKKEDTPSGYFFLDVDAQTGGNTPIYVKAEKWERIGDVNIDGELILLDSAMDTIGSSWLLTGTVSDTLPLEMKPKFSFGSSSIVIEIPKEVRDLIVSKSMFNTYVLTSLSSADFPTALNVILVSQLKMKAENIFVHNLEKFYINYLLTGEVYIAGLFNFTDVLATEQTYAGKDMNVSDGTIVHIGNTSDVVKINYYTTKQVSCLFLDRVGTDLESVDVVVSIPNVGDFETKIHTKAEVVTIKLSKSVNNGYAKFIQEVI